MNYFSLLLLLLTLALPSYAQVADSLPAADSAGLVDSIAIRKIDTPRVRGAMETPFLTESELVDSLFMDTIKEEPQLKKPVVASDTVAVFLLRRAEALALTLSQINRQLQHSMDTQLINRKLNTLQDELDMLDAYFEEVSSQRLDLRGLHSVEAILKEIEARLKHRENELLAYNQRLVNFETMIEEIARDSINRLLPEDFSLRSSYVDQLNDLNQRYQQSKILLRGRLLELGLLQTRLTQLMIRISDLQAQRERYLSEFRQNIMTPHNAPLWQVRPTDYPFTFQAIAATSFRTAGSTLTYFWRYNWGIRLMNIAIVLFFYGFARFTLQKITKRREQDATAVLAPVRYFKRYPEISAVVAGLTIVPFLYGTPPLVFVELIWGILFCLMSWLLYKRLPKILFPLWMTLFVLFLFNGSIALLMAPTFLERWAQFFINVGAVVMGFSFLIAIRGNSVLLNQRSMVRFVVILYLIMNAIAVVMNGFGYYNLALLLSYSGGFQIIFAMALWLFIELMGELTYLYIEANQEELISYSPWMDYEDLQHRFKRVLGFIAIFLWFGAFSKSMGVFELLYDQVDNFLSQPRNLGDATFTYGSVLIFILIIYVSVLISRLLSYVFGSHGIIASSQKKSNIGSTMLLVRIGVMTGGFLFALSAAGIALDKVAIVLGALGVGIGFGLQSIVNNLVSGIILAFEKPVRIGDVIELGGFLGKVKEIGIRSSKLVTFEGADVIIPNGDLLSQQLTNWTLSDQTRRIEMIVGVGYGSDIPAVRAAIEQAINSQEKIMSHPQPLVLVHQFSDSSVDFRVLCWTNHFNEWISIKSDVLTSIYDELRKAAIEIPFPKRDVFVHFKQEMAVPAGIASRQVPLRNESLENEK